MKQITAFLIIACLLLSIKTYAQQISFSKQNATIEDLRKVIEQKTDYNLFYKREYLSQLKPVAIHVTNASLQELLEEFFKYQAFTYKFIKKHITIKPRENPPQISKQINIKGKILNEQGEPIPGATIIVKGTNKHTLTNENGEFTFNDINTSNVNIVITSINYKPEEVTWQGQGQELLISLKQQIRELGEVLISTGYQNIAKEKTPGSYTKINYELLNRAVTTNIIDRLEGITSGLLFNKNITPGANQSAISIRGRSTIFANPNPLIVIDNFPYAGDINNINPNDVENITILKDAEAASIWGAYSGNGVIVITTKKGKYNQPLKLSFNSNVTVGQKPDLYYQPVLSSARFIEVEQFLFDQGFYNSVETNAGRPVLSPAVEIFIQKRDNVISETAAKDQLDILKGQDKRKDLEKYFYRRSLNQQYALSARGGSENNTYYFSVGYDKNLTNLVKNGFDRITLTANNSFAWLKKKLEVNTGIIFTETNQQNINPANVKYPYLKLADDNGNALVVPVDLRQSYKDTAGSQMLLDWNYRPLDELRLSDNTTKTTDYRINADLKCTLFKGMDATVLYQFNKGFVEHADYKSQQTYYTRHLINQFTQVDSSGRIFRNIPLGGILDHARNRYEAHNVRWQLNYNRTWYDRSQSKSHSISAIAGSDVRSINGQVDVMRYYGYHKDLQSNSPVDYDKLFPLYHAPFITRKIENKNRNWGTTDRYISYYVNAKYIFQNRYILSASARKDESNLFGVSTNQKGVPLWAVGASWEISQERFYHWAWLPYLKLRVTHGYNGNVDKSVSAYTTANTNNPNIWGAISGYIANPPNSSLRWEKNQMVNFGIDFAAKNNIITGSLEYYIRKGIDLIGNSPLDPTTGNTQFRGNTADMKGKGADVEIRTKNINKQFKWYSVWLFSYATDKVTGYKVKQSAVWFYAKPQFISPVEGNSLYSIYSFKWMGLDPQTGDPQGYYNKNISKDYTAIYNSPNLNDLVYNGPANPVYFGSLRNTYAWKQLELSFTITCKLGYYFRRNSIHYYSLFLGSQGHPDYEKRWQEPGDENFTTVPSLIYSTDPVRDDFYTHTDILVEKGDHIRLQDVQLNYELTQKKIKTLPVKTVRLYLYANNIGIIWKANDKGIDPDYVSGIPNPRTIAAGIKIDF